jgi:hypothetical protein
LRRATYSSIPLAVPVFNLFAEATPGKSRAEMEALAMMPNVRTVRLPSGKLSFYEKFPDEAAVIREFLTGTPLYLI